MNNALTLSIQGHDTTAAGMSWAMYLIGGNEDIQRKLHEEIDRVRLQMHSYD